MAMQADAAAAEVDRAGAHWTGAAADAAGVRGRRLVTAADSTARGLVLAAVAARDGADQIAAAQAVVLARVADAHGGGFVVADDGTVSPQAEPGSLLIALSVATPPWPTI